MRLILLVAAALAVTAGFGYAICRLAGADPHVGDLSIAGASVLIASMAGLAVLWLNRTADQAAAAQAGLVATMAHLFTAVVLAGVGILVLKRGQSFTYWLLAFYFVTLIVIAGAAARFVRLAPLAKTSPRQ